MMCHGTTCRITTYTEGVGSPSRGSPACRYMYPTDHRLRQGKHSCSIIPACGWLASAPSITSVGLRLSDEMICVAVGCRLGLQTCEPHTCPSSKDVDARRHHGLSCRRARQQRHAQLNDEIWRSIKRAQIPVAKEPVGLSLTDRTRPDDATLIPWSRGNPLAWDVTVPDTFAEAHLKDTAVFVGAAANQAATFKTTKYMSITTTHTFVPIAIEHRELETTKLSRLYRRLACESHRSPVTSMQQTICFNEYPLLSNGECNVISKLVFTRARQSTRPLK